MPSLVCVDASVIVRILVPGPLSDEADALVDEWRRDGRILVAPSFCAVEVLSALRRLCHFGQIQSHCADEAVASFLQLDIRWSHRRDVLPQAWDLARQLNRPTAYDTMYFALAQLQKCEFWTADERLFNAVRDTIACVRWVGEDRTDAM